jgi:hypothetical protein
MTSQHASAVARPRVRHQSTPHVHSAAPSFDAHGPLAPSSLLRLQRSCGNRAVLRLLIQRDTHDNPADFIHWIQAHDAYTGQISNAEGACAPAAKALGLFLSTQGFAVSYRGILLFPRKCDRTELNRNHFVIVVKIAGSTVVVDPTQGQFAGGAAQVALEGDWKTRFLDLKVRVATAGGVNKTYGAKFNDFEDFDGANGFAKERLRAHDAIAGTVLIPQPAEPSKCTIS